MAIANWRCASNARRRTAATAIADESALVATAGSSLAFQSRGELAAWASCTCTTGGDERFQQSCGRGEVNAPRDTSKRTAEWLTFLQVF